MAGMRITRYALLLAVIAWACGHGQSKTADEDVRAFVQNVARDVSTEGPVA